nr:MAG TPA: hypothetical protein [Caudoviricetes sp.]
MSCPCLFVFHNSQSTSASNVFTVRPCGRCLSIPENFLLNHDV